MLAMAAERMHGYQAAIPHFESCLRLGNDQQKVDAHENSLAKSGGDPWQAWLFRFGINTMVQHKLEMDMIDEACEHQRPREPREPRGKVLVCAMV